MYINVGESFQDSLIFERISFSEPISSFVLRKKKKKKKKKFMKFRYFSPNQVFLKLLKFVRKKFPRIW